MELEKGVRQEDLPSGISGAQRPQRRAAPRPFPTSLTVSRFSFPPGMPDFLEKLHTAALKAKKMEIEVRDYMSAKPIESGGEGKASMAGAAEHKSDGTCSPAQLEYA